VVPALPAFDTADTAFDIILSTDAVPDISAVQLPATLTPTSTPTFAGYAAVAVEKEVKTVKATVSFPLTQAQATNPVMKLAIESGVASSLGLDAGLVEIISAGGVAIARRRLGDLAIEFEIQSPAGADAAQATILQENLGTAATTGALVTHVKAKAATAGVLVEALKTMTAELDAPTVEIASKTVTVIEQIRPTAAPTDAPTVAPTAASGSTGSNTRSDTSGSSGVSTGAIVGIVVGILAFVAVIAVVAMNSKKGSGDATPAAGSVPQTKVVVANPPESNV
jgi:hypothetical protein